MESLIRPTSGAIRPSLRLRDVLGAPSATDADGRLKDSETKLEDYTQRVFYAVARQ